MKDESLDFPNPSKIRSRKPADSTLEKKGFNPELKTKNLTEAIPDNPFYDKIVVLTGNLISFPRREDIVEILYKLGADINSTISKKTDIVIIGEKPGPAKLKKIKEINDSGGNIRIIENFELVSLVIKYYEKRINPISDIE